MMTMAVMPQKIARTDWTRVLKIVAVSVLTLPFLLLSALGIGIAVYGAGTAIVEREGLIVVGSLPYLIVGVIGGAACISLLQTTVKGRQVRRPRYHRVAMILGLLPAIYVLIALLVSTGSQNGDMATIYYTLWVVCLCLVTIRQIWLLGSAVKASAHHLQEEL